MAATPESLADQPLAVPGTRPLVWARIASLVSVLPLGVWTVNHLWDNLAAFGGARAWEAAVTDHPHWFSHALTLTIVLVPLILHTIWGLQRVGSWRGANVGHGTAWTFANLRYLLQRLAALGALGFLGAHIWLAMLQPRLVKGHAEPFADIAREMNSHMPTLVVYLLGTLAVSYHLANGISSFAWQWGIVSGRRSLHSMDRLAYVLFAVFMVMSWGAIYALWAAGGRLPGAH